MPPLWPGRSHNTSTAIGRKCMSTRDTGGRYPTHVGARACSKLQPRVTRELEERGNTPATCIQDCMACNSLTTRITRLHGHVLTVCNGKCGCPATQTCRGRSHTAGIHENTERPPAARAVGYSDPAAIGTRAYSAAAPRVNMYICTTQGSAYGLHAARMVGERDRLTSAASLHLVATAGNSA